MLVSHAKNIIFVCSKKKYSSVFRMKEYIALELEITMLSNYFT